MIAEIIFGFLVFMGLLPVAAGVTESKGNTDRSSMDEIKKKKRSLNGHRLQLSNHAKLCRSSIGHYQAFKTPEAKGKVDQTFEKVIEQQIKCGEIFGELHALDKAEEASYNKQEEELNKQVEDLADLVEAAGQEVATAMQASLPVGIHTQASTAGSTQIRKLDVKLTEFRADAADQWFEETERALRVAKVTDGEDKIVVIQKYIPENIREAQRSLFNAGDYQAVKDAVIKAVEKTEREKYKAFQGMQKGDRKPSEAWADLTKLMPERAQDFQDLMMKQKFLEMVGTDLEQHLTDDKLTLANGLHTDEIEKYMQKVDKLYGSKEKTKTGVNSLEKESSSKETEVGEIRSKRESEKQKANRRRRDNRSGSGKRGGNWRDRVCKIHDRFAEKAYSCDKPDTCPMAKSTTKKSEKK